MTHIKSILSIAILFFAAPVLAADDFSARDVFELEVANDPQVSPDGARIVYVRAFMDIMTDRPRSNLWIVNADGSGHQPLTSGSANHSQPRWSPNGDRIAYISTEGGSAQLYMRWMGSGLAARVTNLTSSPGNLVWSPDGRMLALTMHVPQDKKPMITMPKKPEGAKWAEPARVIDSLIYQADGQGFVKPGFTHLFVVPADGGTPRQLTSGDFNHGGRPSWSADGAALIISANRHDDYEYDPVNSELYEVTLADGAITQLTDRQGPDGSPAVSPNGTQIAYVGFDDRYQGYQVTRLYVANRDGSEPRLVSGEFDRSIGNLNWAQNGRSLFISYTDEGKGKVASISIGDGSVTNLVDNMGGLSLGRPYAAGSYSVSDNGVIAYTGDNGDSPADVWVRDRRGNSSSLTALNDDLFAARKTGAVEELWWESSHDGRRIQGWIVTPPDFDPAKKYPLILEIHGGPFAAYGPHFAAEIQLMASAGYVVLYTNPRGSTSYGEEFGNLIDQNYPGEDYDDLMSGVDAIIAKGYIDPENLFVTGGSGGGVLTAWIVGKTDRFRAAVVAKPVINWISFALTADGYNFYYKYWLPGLPWEHVEEYWRRSPLSLVGNVSTPTMLLTGEDDRRTPISETEQYYQALKLRKVETVMVRIPNSFHGIASRPSNLISKVEHILAWFEKYRTDKEAG